MPFQDTHRVRRFLPALVLVALVLASLPAGVLPTTGQAQGITNQPCTLMYAVQQGDTLTSIGTRFGAQVNTLYALNPVLGNQPNIFPGLVLCLSTDPNVTLPGFPGLPPTGATPGVNVVRVNPGRSVTLSTTNFVANTQYIFQMYRYGAANPTVFRVADFITPTGGDFQHTLDIPPQLRDNERIQLRVVTSGGQIIASTAFINRTDSGEPVANCTQYHIVQRGDTLSSIARRYNVSVQQLVLLNNIVDVSLIFSGQRLCVQVGQPNNPPGGGQGQPTMAVLDVDPDQDVTVGGMFFPTGVQINVDIGIAGQNNAGASGYVNVGNFTLARNDDGHFMKTFRIPQGLVGRPNLVVRMTRVDNNRFLTAGFRNARSGGSADPDNFPLAGGASLPDLQIQPGAGNQANSLRQGAPLAATAALQRGRTVNLTQGSAGVYMDQAAYDNALLAAQPVDPHLAPGEGLIFAQPLLQVAVANSSGQVVQEVNGEMYVYFDITGETRQQYDVSQLNIYYYSPLDQAWQPCDSQIPVNEDGPELDRLACQIEAFGLYGVAIRP